jgi:hypothetical protein
VQHLSAELIESLLASAAAKRENRRQAAYAELEAADRDYEADVEAIHRCQGLAPVSLAAPVVPTISPEPEPPNGSPPAKANGSHREWPGLRAAIRGAIAYTPNKFTLDDITMLISDRYPDKAETLRRVHVSGELWRMKRNGEIKVIEEGSGNRPSVYQKDTEAAEAEEASANGRLL